MNYLVILKQIMLSKRLLSAVALCTSLCGLNAYAVNCSSLLEWSSTFDAYVEGNQVKQSGNAYQAKWWSRGNSPATHSGQWDEWRLLGACDGVTASSVKSSVAVASSKSSVAVSSSKSSVAVSSTKSSVKSSVAASSKVSSKSSSSSSLGGSDCGSAWYKANLTNYESYPDPGSEECTKFNGCQWAGQFFGLSGKQSEAWVKANNIVAVHSKDWSWLGMKTVNLRQGNKKITSKVYDECSDSDCNGCCTQNLAGDGYLIDIEKYTMERFGSGEGIVEFQMCN